MEERNESLLRRAFDGIGGERRWERMRVVRADAGRGRIDAAERCIGGGELFDESGERVRMIGVVAAVARFFEKNEIIEIDVFVNSVGDGKLKVTAVVEKCDFGLEEMLSLISLIISSEKHADRDIRNTEKRNSEVFLSFGENRCVADIDNELCAISDLNYMRSENVEPPNLTFIIDDDSIFSDFYSFACSVLIWMAYVPFLSLNLFLGCDMLLLRVPPLKDRRMPICNMMFDVFGNVENFDYSLESFELNSVVNAKLFYFDSKKPTFSFLFYLDGIPQKSNDECVLNLLSSISWSETFGSLLPSKMNENQYFLSSPFLKKKGKSFVLFLNCSNDNSQSLCVIVINKIYEMFIEKYPNYKIKSTSRKRLDGIWSNISSISKGVCSILNDFHDYDNIWNGISQIIDKNHNLILST